MYFCKAFNIKIKLLFNFHAKHNCFEIEKISTKITHIKLFNIELILKKNNKLDRKRCLFSIIKKYNRNMAIIAHITTATTYTLHSDKCFYFFTKSRRQEDVTC